MEQRKYIIKNLAPWMMDELIAFSRVITYDLILLRSQKNFYDEHLNTLKNNGVNIYIQPGSNKFLIKKIWITLFFFFGNLHRFGWDYNFVVGTKSILWFLKMDMSLFSESSNIHAQFATQAPLVGLLIKKFYGNKPKVSFTFHAYDIYFKNKWFKKLTSESEVAFSISDYNIRYIKDNYGVSNKIALSRLGVFRRGKELEKKESNSDCFIIGLLSWFLEKKGIIYLLEAVKIISERESVKMKLLLAGDGPLKNTFDTYIDTHNIGDYIEFVGTINSEQKEEFFTKLNAFVMPSVALKNDQDGIPVVIMEALDYSLPIISTEVSGIPEICKNNYNGKLIPERDAVSLADSIEFLCNNNELTRTFGKNSKAMSEEYDIEINSKKKLGMIGWV
ncbi:glycosyltransferase [Lutimonas vermicola]|uniref:Glycosyltransferase n=1 Tax=Lutimonas vermicola TaxID=414288 RepID=A0ABU9KZ63_9FLAO